MWEWWAQGDMRIFLNSKPQWQRDERTRLNWPRSAAWRDQRDRCQWVPSLTGPDGTLPIAGLHYIRIVNLSGLGARGINATVMLHQRSLLKALLHSRVDYFAKTTTQTFSSFPPRAPHVDGTVFNGSVRHPPSKTISGCFLTRFRALRKAYNRIFWLCTFKAGGLKFCRVIINSWPV